MLSDDHLADLVLEAGDDLRRRLGVQRPLFQAFGHKKSHKRRDRRRRDAERRRIQVAVFGRRALADELSLARSISCSALVRSPPVRDRR